MPPPLPPLPAGKATPGSISPRKLVLSVVLAGSILFFFLILFAGGIAILREGSPREGRGGLTALVFKIRHIIAPHLAHHK